MNEEKIVRIDILDFANWLVQWSYSNGIPFSHLKLQKILYYCQSWHLVFFNQEPLFEDAPEAWSNGPVYRTVYDEFKTNPRHLSIPYESENIEDFNIQDNDLGLSNPQLGLIEQVLQTYGSMQDEQLVYLTHVEEPWNEARKDCEPFALCTKPISMQTMFEYYKSRLDRSKSTERAVKN